MKKYKPYFNFKEDMNMIITPEMNDYFFRRTDLHRELVAKYGYKLADILENSTGKSFNKFRNNIKWHDIDKYKEPIIEPYILISWYYKCKKDNIEFILSDDMKEEMNEASEIHVKSNKHHPECWTGRVNVIPKNDREKFDPDSVPTIEIEHMPFIYLCEMVADWCAMSKELGTNTPKEWANRVLNKRWKFSEKQTKQIYKLIDLIWE